jgi:hypothetical protein
MPARGYRPIVPALRPVAAAVAVSALLVAALAAALSAAQAASACVCPEAPIGERFDDADVALVGRVVSVEEAERGGELVRLLTVAVEQRVKGDVEGELVVRSPARTGCDLVLPESRSVGLLLTRAPDGAWLGSACSIADPGQLVAAGDEPRGGAIKVVIGVVVLGLVLLLAFARLRRGSRPWLPGGPTA